MSGAPFLDGLPLFTHPFSQQKWVAPGVSNWGLHQRTVTGDVSYDEPGSQIGVVFGEGPLEAWDALRQSRWLGTGRNPES